ncbi:MAG TPA: ABC transporter ATP-binding protein [Candidatus Cloacimonadota bacterium]|nr:ABC transporter ATP-binding protein [Candidatus Cloacimonadota bacterium]HPT72702.1 ABC transporter ATP-binding protein [Candidatus Cloacimonadota bacterium]
MISIKNVTVGFGERTILEDITMEIPEKKTTVIIGRSGSGKSVLIKTVEGLLVPSKGEILVDGVNIHKVHGDELRNVRRLLAMLFQGAALFDSLNVFQNVALPLVEHTGKDLNEINDLVEEKLEMVGLKDVMQKMPSELSGGMRKRIALARAIILEPKYVIYDEPTTGLDPVSSAEIVDLILHLQEKCNITSIVITHDLDCIRRTGENIAMLHLSKLIFRGSYEEIIRSEIPAVQSFFQPGR